MNKQKAVSGYKAAEREALLVLFLWCSCAAYTLGYCRLYGYNRSIGELEFVLGVPDWVFWGILLPWTLCLAVGLWMAVWFMKDEELGEEHTLQIDSDGQQETHDA